MRGIARLLLFLFAFTIPWEYSLDLGTPWGNVARVIGLVLLLVTELAVLQAGGLRRPGTLQWLTLALFLWFCCSWFWSITPETTGAKLRGYFQEMMLVWLVWELMETPRDLRNLIRAWLGGSWVLALLTIANFGMHDPVSSEQIRFAAVGQDPNDVARYIDLGFPLAAVLMDGRERWPERLLAAGYIPLGFACVLLTASRSGFLVAVVALVGCGAILFRRTPGTLLAGSLILPGLAGLVWFVAPHETLLRLGTIAEQLRNADLNQRFNIWEAGWHAFVSAPLVGHGAGSFVTAAGLAPEDTAHNTVLSMVVEGGLVALALTGAIVLFLLKALFRTTGSLQVALFTAVGAWLMSSLVETVGESRTTWLLLATIALANRLTDESRQELESAFPNSSRWKAVEPAAELP